ncbi:NlpC/P60 family protein [Fodinibius salsisoli]|uniref:C40 family peptidase n=1 Tax=Fodinibius salsisoli TaxID=2820877 RepID=A0ABT3PK01_9BACT|nr:NlpC/P60 family protein [Fodinibius salsisoli]MCW9706281.1 C40 family peptidase [Fodinibius salsisoli]
MTATAFARYKNSYTADANNPNDVNPPSMDIGLETFLSTVNFNFHSIAYTLKFSIHKHPILKGANSAAFLNSGIYGFSSLKTLLSQAFKEWKGTPYLYGGNSSAGVDCSAFIQKVFREYFDMKLPRTTRQQIDKGKSISKYDLRAGDLVFFRTSHTRLHVGVLLNQKNFIHASSSEGVTISSLDNNYWMGKYLDGRRILTNELLTW